MPEVVWPTSERRRCLLSRQCCLARLPPDAAVGGLLERATSLDPEQPAVWSNAKRLNMRPQERNQLGQDRYGAGLGQATRCLRPRSSRGLPVSVQSPPVRGSDRARSSRGLAGPSRSQAGRGLPPAEPAPHSDATPRSTGIRGRPVDADRAGLPASLSPGVTESARDSQQRADPRYDQLWHTSRRSSVVASPSAAPWEEVGQPYQLFQAELPARSGTAPNPRYGFGHVFAPSRPSAVGWLHPMCPVYAPDNRHTELPSAS
jgi:hypothetical protein